MDWEDWEEYLADEPTGYDCLACQSGMAHDVASHVAMVWAAHRHEARLLAELEAWHAKAEGGLDPDEV